MSTKLFVNFLTVTVDGLLYNNRIRDNFKRVISNNSSVNS